jgi:hypothetical protein
MRDHPVFKKCELIVDPAPFIDACKYDICADSNQYHRDLYRCRAFSAYMFECASKGVLIDWMNYEDLRDLKIACHSSHYGKCIGGSLYSECSRIFKSSCKDISNPEQNKYSREHELTDVCIPGCSCPENYYFELVNGQKHCVKKESCSCFNIGTRRYHEAGDKIKRGCSTW